MSQEAVQAGRPVREQKAVLVLPDIGLQEHEIEALKARFHNSMIEAMGGPEAVARRPVVIIVIIIVNGARAE